MYNVTHLFLNWYSIYIIILRGILDFNDFTGKFHQSGEGKLSHLISPAVGCKHLGLKNENVHA